VQLTTEVQKTVTKLNYKISITALTNLDIHVQVLMAIFQADIG